MFLLPCWWAKLEYFNTNVCSKLELGYIALVPKQLEQTFVLKYSNLAHQQGSKNNDYVFCLKNSGQKCNIEYTNFYSNCKAFYLSSETTFSNSYFIDNHVLGKFSSKLTFNTCYFSSIDLTGTYTTSNCVTGYRDFYNTNGYYSYGQYCIVATHTALPPLRTATPLPPRSPTKSPIPDPLPDKTPIPDPSKSSYNTSVQTQSLKFHYFPNDAIYIYWYYLFYGTFYIGKKKQNCKIYLVVIYNNVKKFFPL